MVTTPRLIPRMRADLAPDDRRQPPADQPLRPLYDDFRDANNKGRLDTVQGSGGEATRTPRGTGRGRRRLVDHDPVTRESETIEIVGP